jgi:hypothetical protein
LKKSGLISLKQQIIHKNLINENLPVHIKDAKAYHCQVVLNDQISLYYDLHDSWEIDEEALKKCDLYFKRSFDEKALCGKYDNTVLKKIKPLGINFWAVPDHFSLFKLKRDLLSKDDFKRKFYHLLVASGVFDSQLQLTRISDLETIPDTDQEPKIFFITRTWDPHPENKYSEKKEKERKEINEKRAECIRLLQKEFGEKFVGGFFHSEYARQTYKDLLLPENLLSITRRREYMKTMESCPIGISTRGWHECIPWRIGEYLIKGRAIITEQIEHKVPGNFSENKNYLAYDTPEECLKHAKDLFNDHEKRKKMMLDNFRYYYNYVKAENLVLNSLLTALETFES